MTGGRSCLLGVSDSSSGTETALTRKRLPIGVDSGISGYGDGSDGSSSRIIGSFIFFTEQTFNSDSFV